MLISKDVIFSYLCIPTQARGSFNPKKAKDIKGLVPKLHYKLLTAGEIVTLEDGVIVTPQDVCEDPTPSQCFLFVFLDDPSQLEGLLKNADLASLMKELVPLLPLVAFLALVSWDPMALKSPWATNPH